MIADKQTEQALILFDGVCKFCNATVQFVIKRDARRRFRFCPLQSPVAQALLAQHKINQHNMDTMVLVQNNQAYVKSTAALKIARQLVAPWPLLYVFILVPPLIRHKVYDFIGRRRYRWFGKLDHCMVPDENLQQRFWE